MVRQRIAAPYAVGWPIGPQWAGYHLYQLALLRHLNHPDGTPTGEVGWYVVYIRLWLPEQSWYGVMEDHQGRPPEQSLRGPGLVLAPAEHGPLLDLLRTTLSPIPDPDEDLCRAIEADYRAHYAEGSTARSWQKAGHRLGYSDRHLRRVWSARRGKQPRPCPK